MAGGRSKYLSQQLSDSSQFIFFRRQQQFMVGYLGMVWKRRSIYSCFIFIVTPKLVQWHINQPLSPIHTPSQINSTDVRLESLLFFVNHKMMQGVQMSDLLDELKDPRTHLHQRYFDSILASWPTKIFFRVWFIMQTSARILFFSFLVIFVNLISELWRLSK